MEAFIKHLLKGWSGTTVQGNAKPDAIRQTNASSSSAFMQSFSKGLLTRRQSRSRRWWVSQHHEHGSRSKGRYSSVRLSSWDWQLGSTKTTRSQNSLPGEAVLLSEGPWAKTSSIQGITLKTHLHLAFSIEKRWSFWVSAASSEFLCGSSHPKSTAYQ